MENPSFTEKFIGIEVLILIMRIMPPDPRLVSRLILLSWKEFGECQRTYFLVAEPRQETCSFVLVNSRRTDHLQDLFAIVEYQLVVLVHVQGYLCVS